MSWVRLAPVTSESLLICVVVYVSCSLQSALFHERFESVQHDWGAIQLLELVQSHDGVRDAAELELTGPFDAWRGEFWRIPVTVLHHTSLTHLVVSLVLGWYLGHFLERCWGSLRFLLFLIPASCLPAMMELCLGRAYQGLSGTLCAILGALIVILQRDENLANDFSDLAASIGLAAILFCWLSSIIGFISFPNAAHFAGLIYGAFVATVFRTESSIPLIRWSAVVLAHAAIVPAMWSVTHPTWIGRYHWFKAATMPNSDDRDGSYERAIRCDPSLVGAWLQWSRSAESNGRTLLAWERLVLGLATNSSSPSLIEEARRIWRHLEEDDRHVAEAVLEKTFGKRAALWRNQIRAGNSLAADSYENDRDELQKENLDDKTLDQKLELPNIKSVTDSNDRLQPSEFPAPVDAVEGERL